MKPGARRTITGLLLLAALATAISFMADAQEPTDLSGRLVAVGIPGAGAVAAVGAFHPGGPIQDKPAFRAYTASGAVLDSARLFVASSSNYGAPLGRAE